MSGGRLLIGCGVGWNEEEFVNATRLPWKRRYLALEETIWPASALSWLSIVALGIGPVGLAFFTWDIGMKRGDIQLLGDPERETLGTRLDILDQEG